MVDNFYENLETVKIVTKDEKSPCQGHTISKL